MTRSYFVVEGPHDVELIGRLLKWWHLERVRRVEEVDQFWLPLIPTTFPHDGDLLTRVPVPTFFARGDVQVAVAVAIGDTNIAQLVNTDLAIPEFAAHELNAIALVLDSDTKEPATRWRSLRRQLAIPSRVRAVVPDAPNEVAPSIVRFGALVLPGDGSKGTLETLLLDCGRLVYPKFVKEAQRYVKRVDDHARTDARAREMRDFDKPAGRNKARVAAIVAALKPGKATQVSIQDNRWVNEAARAVPALEACLQFVASILGTPVPAQGTQ